MTGDAEELARFIVTYGETGSPADPDYERRIVLTDTDDNATHWLTSEQALAVSDRLIDLVERMTLPGQWMPTPRPASLAEHRAQREGAHAPTDD